MHRVCSKETATLQVAMPHALGALLGTLLGHLRSLPPGQYLLTHAAHAGQVGCWRAAAAPSEAGQVRSCG